MVIFRHRICWVFSRRLKSSALLPLHSVYSQFYTFSTCTLIFVLIFINHDSQCILPYQLFSYWWNLCLWPAHTQFDMANKMSTSFFKKLKEAKPSNSKIKNSQPSWNGSDLLIWLKSFKSQQKNRNKAKKKKNRNRKQNINKQTRNKPSVLIFDTKTENSSF